MFQFDINKLYTERKMLKSITTALGGSMMVVDHNQSTNDEEVYKKVNVPFAVARLFVKSTGNVTQFMVPIEVEVLYYNDEVVCIERSPFRSSDEDEQQKEWTSNISHNIKFIEHITNNQPDWYIDGKFVYQYFNQSEFKGEYLNHSGTFRSIVVDAINLQRLYIIQYDKEKNPQGPKIEQRSCIAFITSDNQSAVSPPIWKTMSIGDQQLTKISDGEYQGNNEYRFDIIDDNLAVNINFVLNAGHHVSKIFGYQSIECLALDELMIDLCTVNLPNIHKTIKQTHDCGLPFTHALAWLIGLSTKTTTLNDYSTICQLMKYLSSKGVFKKQTFEHENLFYYNHHKETVPLIKNASSM